MESSYPISGLDAARLAFLALRASLNRSGDGLPTIYRLANKDTALSPEQTAALLAEHPKPLQYRGAVDGDALRVEISPIVDEFRLAIRSSSTRQREPLHFLRARYGAAIEELDVVCFGGGEHLRLTVAALRAWKRDYYLSLPHSCGMDFADSDYAHAQCAARLDLSDAAAFASFGPGGGVQLIIR